MVVKQTVTEYNVNALQANKYAVERTDSVYEVKYTPFAVTQTNTTNNTITKIAGQNINGHKVVCVKADGYAYYADASQIDTAAVIGIATSAVLLGEYTTIQGSGSITNDGWNWTIGEPVFVGTNGALTQTYSSSVYSVTVGIAIATDTINIEIQQPIF